MRWLPKTGGHFWATQFRVRGPVEPIRIGFDGMSEPMQKAAPRGLPFMW
jgi:hypothetical protein